MADAQGDVIGSAIIDVMANMAPFEASMAAIPKRAADSAATAEASFKEFTAELTAGLARVERTGVTATHSVNAGMAGVGAGAGMSSYRVQQLGQTIDDLQYVGEQGLRPIINNLMQISPILGVAALAVDQLARHWSQVMAAFGEDEGLKRAERSIEGLTARIKELKAEVEKAPTVANLHELETKEGSLRRAQQDKATDEALEKGRSESSRKSRDAAMKAINETGDSPGEGYNKLAVDLASRAAATPETQAQQQRIAVAEAELVRLKETSNNTRLEIQTQKEQQDKITGMRETLRILQVDAAKAQIDAAMGDADRLRVLAAQVTDAKLKAALLAATPEAMQEKAQRDALNKRDDEMGAIFGAPKAIAKLAKEQEKADRKAEAEFEKVVGATNKGIIGDWERAEAEHRKKSDELARAILKNPELGGATPTHGQVRDALDKAGFGDKDLDGQADRVAASVKRLAGEKDAQDALSGANGPLALAENEAKMAALRRQLNGNAGNTQSLDAFVGSIAGAALKSDERKAERELAKQRLAMLEKIHAELLKKKPGQFR